MKRNKLLSGILTMALLVSVFPQVNVYAATKSTQTSKATESTQTGKSIPFVVVKDSSKFVLDKTIWGDGGYFRMDAIDNGRSFTWSVGISGELVMFDGEIEIVGPGGYDEYFTISGESDTFDTGITESGSYTAYATGEAIDTEGKLYRVKTNDDSAYPFKVR